LYLLSSCGGGYFRSTLRAVTQDKRQVRFCHCERSVAIQQRDASSTKNNKAANKKRMFVDPPKRSEQLLKYALIALGITLVVVMLSALFRVGKQDDAQPVTPPVVKTDNAPKRIDLGTTLPDTIPTDIRAEKESPVQQNYSLRYSGQTQTTTVFRSPDTPKKNHEIYTDSLKKDGWIIVNDYQSEGIFSLYAEKGNEDMNVTITGDSTSEISMSILEKEVL